MTKQTPVYWDGSRWIVQSSVAESVLAVLAKADSVAQSAKADAKAHATDGPAADPIADLCARLRALHIIDEVGSDNPLGREAADALERLAREIAQWKVWPIAEIAARNPSVLEYMRHWEGRAERAEAEWRRECADADNILFASGLTEPHLRTDGGSLQVPRIVAHFKELIAERDALRECVKAADKLRYNYFMGDGKLYDAARAKVKP